MDNEHTADAPQSDPPANSVVDVYSFGPFRIEVTARHLVRGDTLVPLTSKVFDTLLMLVKNHDRAISKEELIHAVWPNTFVSDDSLVQNISAIRRALGDDSSQPQYVVTLARRGYRFIAPVTLGDNPEARVSTGVDEHAHLKRSSTASRSPWWLVGAFAAGIVVTAFVSMALRSPRTQPAAGDAIRFRELGPPGQMLEGGAALSPDGRSLAFVATDGDGMRHLWVRSLGGDAARVLEGTVGARSPFWSPDSQSIAYFAGYHIKRIPAVGGASRPIVTLQRSLPLGGTWGSTDQILYCDQGKIFSVAASGGKPVTVASPSEANGGEFRSPQFFPDGRRFLFVNNSDNPSRLGVYLGTVGSNDTVRLTNESGTTVVYTSGYLLFVRDRVLMAQAFDFERGQLKGEPKTILGDVADRAEISAAGDGLLALSENVSGARAVWFDRTGRELSSFKVPRVFGNIALSPDSKQALATSSDGGFLALWKLDLERNVTTRLASNSGFSAWNPDGIHFAFISVGMGGAADILVRSTMNTEQSVLLKTDDIKVVSDWSPDGRYVVFSNNQSGEQGGLWMVPTAGDHKPVPLVHAQGRVTSGRVSPDGHWLAYVSDETGAPEVYLESFPDMMGHQQVSTDGGTLPVWRRDGRELFYLSANRHLMAVATPPSIHVSPGKPQALFPMSTASFAATKDGLQFLTVVPDHAEAQRTITVLVNWTSATK